MSHLSRFPLTVETSSAVSILFTCCFKFFPCLFTKLWIDQIFAGYDAHALGGQHHAVKAQLGACRFPEAWGMADDFFRTHLEV